ncbi:pseudouridine synthase [Flectobacillus major]|uniref:pseudouridine synthase n=1 Tax=Flectobacillus major TaxID=103 RepID=UPI0009DB74EC|nr:pseudouridine synthase [Flectobacillus major]
MSQEIHALLEKNSTAKKREFKPRTEGGYEKREFNRDSRPPRREFDGEKREFKPRTEGGYEKREFNRDSRPPRKEFNGEKREFKPRTEGGYEKREFNRDSRPPRREFNGEKREFKPRTEGGYEKREFNRDSRPPRREFNGEKREFKPRTEGGYEKREFNRDSRPPRRELDGEKREFKPRTEGGYEKREFNRDSRPPRREFDGEKREFKPRTEGGYEKREFNRDSRPPRREFNGEKREFKPRTEGGYEKREFNKDARPPRREFDGEKREFKPRTEGGYEKRAPRAEKTFGSAKVNFGGKNLFRAHRPVEESDKWTPNYQIDKFKESAPKKIQKQIEKSEHASTDVRLNRYIANAGICSRREADDLIKAGEIKVNGKVVTEMGYQVKPGDIVKYGNRKLSREKTVYVLVNKPKDFITTTEDPNERKTVMDLVKNACEERIYPVGRLDRNTTGLLLLTNDGELADKLTHPSNEIEKLYQVELDKPLTTEHFDQILKGLSLEDGEIKADELAIVTPDAMVVGIKIHSGRNRIVRRIFESLGYEVLKLDRTTFAGLNKKDLPRGTWRFLTEKEVIKLKYFV